MRRATRRMLLPGFGGRPSAAPNGLLTNLVACWELNEASGNALDAVGGVTLTQTSGTMGSVAGPGTSLARELLAADTEFFQAATDAPAFGDIDFTVAIWGYVPSLPGGDITLFGKHAGGANKEWRLGIRSTGVGFFAVSHDATNYTFRNATTFGTLPTNTWFLLVGWHDSVNNVIGVSVNAGAADTTSYSTGLIDTTATVTVGESGFSSNVAQARVWSRILTANDRTALYNGGNGLPYTSFTN